MGKKKKEHVVFDQMLSNKKSVPVKAVNLKSKKVNRMGNKGK